MKRLPFERPTDYYDVRVRSIDEQICELLQRRKEISSGNPGFPYDEDIESWSKEFGIYEEFLRALFGYLRSEEQFRSRVEPDVFKKHVSVLKTIEKQGKMFTMTHIRQYDNASVVLLHVDLVPSQEDEQTPYRHHHGFLELYIGDHFDCRSAGGGGSHHHHTSEFVVSPPLPDNLAGICFVFREKKSPNGDPTGLEIQFDME